MNETTKALMTPLSIVIAGAFVGIGLYLGGTGSAPAPVAGGLPAADRVVEEAPVEAGPQEALALDLDQDEYIYGNPDAEVMIVEYSDIDCPFCARVHPTLEQVVDNSNGEIAWVFRHFPLDQLHPQARGKAIATECVGRLAGNDAFWSYLDGLMQQGPIDAYTDYGISAAQFESCLDDPDMAAAVDLDVARAIESGGRGTPHSVVATESLGIVVSGAQPAQVWTQTATTLLQS